MDISVIVPIYGVEPYIERCLHSLFNQTKSSGVEFILVDDCTPDNSMQLARSVVAQYPEREVKFVSHEQNRGLVAARQSGLEVASGDYVMHIDSDDWCEAEMLEELFAKATEEDADIVSCDLFRNYATRQTLIRYEVTQTDGVEAAKAYIRRERAGFLHLRLIRRSLYTDNDIRPIEEIVYGEDLILTTRLYLVAKRVAYIPKAYYHYNLTNEGSICATMSTEKLKQFYVLLPQVLEQFIKERGLCERVGEDLIKCKVISKYKILERAEPQDRKELLNIHPEVNGDIWRMKDLLPPIKRFALIHASKGRLCVFNACYDLLRFQKRMRRSFNKRFGASKRARQRSTSGQ